MLAGLVDDYTDRGAYDCAFVDVPKNAPYFNDVAYMSSKGMGSGWTQPVKYVVGDAENRFHPDALITRGELAAIMARMQGLKGDDSPALTSASSGAPVTRAEFVAAANRMTGRSDIEPPRDGLPKFSDVPASRADYAEIMKASATYPVRATPSPSEKKPESRVAP